MKIRCCLCSRRTDSNGARKRIGSASVWPLFELHILKIGLKMSQFCKEDFVCLKCYSSIAHYGMTDRGPNKAVKIKKPVVFESLITKSVLRGFNRSEASKCKTFFCFTTR